VSNKVVDRTLLRKEDTYILCIHVSLDRTGDEPRWLTNERYLWSVVRRALASAASLLPSGVSIQLEACRGRSLTVIYVQALADRTKGRGTN
jgi:hypothetical protein